MGQWDVYCAICGGPFAKCTVQVWDKPRSEAFKAARRGEETQNDSDELLRELVSYDPDIISKEDTAWTWTNLLVLGFNPNTRGLSHAFIAAGGWYDEMGFITADEAFEEDRNFDDEAISTCFQCYTGAWEDKDINFPFHKQCYDVFRGRLALSIGHGRLESDDSWVAVDKDALYSTMRAAADRSHLDIGYGVPEPDRYLQFWDSNPGEEIFVSDPGPVDGLEDRIRSMIDAGYFTLPEESSSEMDLSHRVRDDPFKGLPYELLVRIAEQFDTPTALLNWARASWFAHSLLKTAAASFWMNAAQTQMSWFPELQITLRNAGHELLARPGASSTARAIYLWAAFGSLPRLGMKSGPFLRIANRRRIWEGPCTELVDRYCRNLPTDLPVKSAENEAPSFLQTLHSKAKGSRLYMVTHDKQARRKDDIGLYGEMRRCFWLHEWEDTYSKRQLVEVFFGRADGFLVGIAVTTEGRERQLLGSGGSDLESLRLEAVIPTEDWICGIVLHIPAVEVVGNSKSQAETTKSSPRGITIICASGREHHLGETEQGHPVRPLVARPGHQLVGLQAQMAGDPQTKTFTRMSLITLRDKHLDGRRILPSNIVRRPYEHIDDFIWRGDGTYFFGVPWWNNLSVRFLGLYELDNFFWVPGLYDEPEISPQLMPQEVLLWGKDAAELRQLTKISIFTTYMRTDSDGDAPFQVYRICGVGAEFSTGHVDGRRLVGMEGKLVAGTRRNGDIPVLSGPQIAAGCLADTSVSEMKGDGDFRFDMEIDGPGGEVVTEVFVDSRRWISLKLRTNFGREGGCYLGTAKQDVDEIYWKSIKVKPSRPIIGLIVTFAHGCGDSETSDVRTFKEITGVSALSVRSYGDAEETSGDEWDDEDGEDAEDDDSDEYYGESEEYNESEGQDDQAEVDEDAGGIEQDEVTQEHA